MNGKIGGRKEDKDSGEVVHDIDRHGSLYVLLNAFLGAYNRRTDVMHAQIDPEAFKALTASLKASADDLETAVDDSTK